MVLLGHLENQAQPVHLDLRRNCVLAMLEADLEMEDLDLADLHLADPEMADLEMKTMIKEEKVKKEIKAKKETVKETIEEAAQVLGDLVVPVRAPAAFLELVFMGNKLTIIITIYHVYHCKYCY